MKTYLVLASGTDPQFPPASSVARAQTLGVQLLIGDPTGQITAYPSVVVLSSSYAAQIFPDDTGQATPAEIQAAQTAATNAEGASTTAKQAVATYLSTVATTIAGAQAQITADVAILKASTDPLAPIIERNLTRLVYIANMVMHLAAMTTEAVNVENITVLS